MLIATQKCYVLSPRCVAKILRNILKTEDAIDRKKEHFWTIGLSANNTVEYVDLVTLGTMDFGITHPRETYRLAVMKGVSRIITAHNHPSGTLTPSLKDLQVVKTLIKAGEIIGIKMLDHLIITETGFTSLNKKNASYNSTQTYRPKAACP